MRVPRPTSVDSINWQGYTSEESPHFPKYWWSWRTIGVLEGMGLGGCRLSFEAYPFLLKV